MEHRCEKFMGLKVSPADTSCCGLLPLRVVAVLISLLDLTSSLSNLLLLYYLRYEEFRTLNPDPAADTTRLWIWVSLSTVPVSLLGLLAALSLWKSGLKLWSDYKQVYWIGYTSATLWFALYYCEGEAWHCTVLTVSGVLVHRVAIDLYLAYLLWSTVHHLYRNRETLVKLGSSAYHLPDLDTKNIEMSAQPLIKSPNR